MYRREFLGFLAGSPLLGDAAVLQVDDFAPLAKAKIQPQHWAYLQGGSDDDRTVAANAAAYGRWQLRARRFVDVERVDAGVTLFGTAYPGPVLLAPVGSQRAFHGDAELATARAAKGRRAGMILSTNTSLGVGPVSAALGGAPWYQLYPTNDFGVTTALIRAAERARCQVLVVTADSAGSSNRVTQLRAGVKTEARCVACHGGPGLPEFFARHGMYEGIDMARVTSIGYPVSWELVEKIRAVTSMKLVMKGVMTAEDASFCMRHGVDGMIVSNHGGRQEESLMGTAEALPEIAAVVNGRVPVLVDGGIRRGTDIFKALALGANAVCIGRPYIWGLGAMGQAGVERVLELLQAEFVAVMKLCGVRRITDISPLHLKRQ